MYRSAAGQGAEAPVAPEPVPPAPPSVETAHVEADHVEAAHVEAARVEAARVEAARIEAAVPADVASPRLDRGSWRATDVGSASAPGTAVVLPGLGWVGTAVGFFVSPVAVTAALLSAPVFWALGRRQKSA